MDLRKRIKNILPGLVILSCCLLSLKSQIPAFPGAEGHGRYVNGGRGGKVIEVTNLLDQGEGSLRAAVEASGARTVVFRVSGTIQLESNLYIRNDSISIAGQTAPGDGITLRDYQAIISANQVIIRFLRFRMGDAAEQEGDAVGGRFHKDIILDHCSMSWSTDECVSFYHNEDFSLQWSIISESLANSVHDKGSHGYGGIWGGRNASFHHNLLAHHDSRNPRLGETSGHEFALTDLVDLRNNVIYNWGGNSCYGGEAMNANIVNCYYKPGPATRNTSRIIAIYKSDVEDTPVTDTWGKFYIDGNVMTSSAQVTNDNWTYGVYNQFNSKYGVLTEEEKQDMRLDEALDAGEVFTHTAQEAYQLVLRHGGASIVRDTVDLRILHDVRTGTATCMDGGNGSVNGIIDTQEAVGGWPVLNSTQAPADRDSDGMPDEWENQKELDPDNPEDRNDDRIGDGYTNLEEYLNSLVSIPWDLEPMLKIYAPLPGSGYFLTDTIPVKALSGARGAGSIESFQLFVDKALVCSLDTAVMDTILTGLAPGPHWLHFETTDNQGITSADSLRIYLGTIKHKLTLNEGSGEGEILVEPGGSNFMEGTVVSLQANPEFTYLFKDWNGDFGGTVNSLVVTMDSAIELRANFVRDSGLFTRINFQPFDSNVPAGYFPDVGDAFGLRDSGIYYGWGGNNYESIMRSGVDDPRKATFNQMQNNGSATWELALPDGTYAVNVHMGDGSSTSQVNSITIEGFEMTDTVAGNHFDEYYLGDVAVSDGALTLIPTGVNAKINYIKVGPADWVFGRFLRVIKGSGEGDHPIGSVVEVKANKPIPGYAFSKWSGDTIYIGDTQSANSTFTMPEVDAVLTANYWIPTYTIIVNNGKGSGSHEVGDKFYISADDPPEGQVFSAWEVLVGDAGSISDISASFSWVTMPASDMEVSAKYEDVTGVPDQLSTESEEPCCYPNPAKDEFYIHMEESGKKTIRIFDSAGQQVYNKVSSENTHTINTGHLHPGIFIVVMSGENGRTFTKKQVIE